MSETATYNAWEEDLATLNIFFGQETAMGKPEDVDQQENEMQETSWVMIPKHILNRFLASQDTQEVMWVS